VERFDKKQEPKHDNEGGVELIPEDRESQKRLCDEKPKTVIEPLATTLMAGIQVLLGTNLDLARSKSSKEDFLDNMGCQQSRQETEIGKYLARVGI
jgi:hypothetical protein